MRVMIGLLALAWAGCGHGPRKTEQLMSAVRGYNDSLRWQRYAVAATHVPPRERDLFLDERADLRENLRISGYEVRRVSYGARGARARVHVEYTWHLDNRGVVHQTTAMQLWELRGKRWWLASEARTRGDRMPGVPEPAPRGEKRARAVRAGTRAPARSD